MLSSVPSLSSLHHSHHSRHYDYHCQNGGRKSPWRRPSLATVSFSSTPEADVSRSLHHDEDGSGHAAASPAQAEHYRSISYEGAWPSQPPPPPPSSLPSLQQRKRRPLRMAANFFEFLQINKHKTFRPKKRFTPGTLRHQLHRVAEATLNQGVDLRAAVRLPHGESLDDWLAVHTVDFFNRVNLMYGTISEACTSTSCPTMSGGNRFEYLWQDGVQFKKPTRLPAPQYMQRLMDWIEERVNDETIFPCTTDVPFPREFRQICRKILTRLFRVFVHIYIHHSDRVQMIGAEPHINTLYKHFYYFVTEHQLVSPKELEALKEVTGRLIPKN